MTKKLTVQIAETGTFIGSSLDNQPKKEVIDLQSLNNLKKAFLGSIPVNINHNKDNIIGELKSLNIIQNKLIGNIYINDKYMGELKDKYISPEFILEDGKPKRLIGLGIVSKPAIDNAKIL